MRERPSGVGRTRLAGPAMAAPLVALVAYLALFTAHSAEIVGTLYLNGDIASGPVIAQALATTPGSPETLLGNYPWFEALGLLSLLHALPAHRFLWELTPFIFAAATFGLVALGTWRAAGPTPALLTLTVGLAAAPAAVSDLGSWTVHGLTWLHVALLGWLAVWLAGRRARKVSLLVAAIVGLACGPALASDLLLIPGGLLPLWIAAIALRFDPQGSAGRDRATPLLAALVTTSVAAPIALITAGIAHDHHIRGAGTLPIRLVEVGRLGHNLKALWESLATLGNGDVFNVSFGASTFLHGVCAALAVLALAAALRAAVGSRRNARTPQRLAHGAFWGTAIVALIAGFTLSSVPIAAFSGRYLVGVLMGVAALAPLAACGGRTGRALTITAVTFFALVGVMSLDRGEMSSNSNRFPTAAEAELVAHYVAGQAAPEGYAGYWDAASITWATDFRAPTRPVGVCTAGLCPYQLHRVAAWYRPRPLTRSYLVIDDAVRQQSLTSLSPSLGTPLASTRIAQLTVYIFAGDIARRFGPPLSGKG